MKEHIQRFIFTPLEDALDECRVALCNKGLEPGDLIAHRMILDGAFLRMCGLLEQKVLNILWYIGFNHPEERHDLLKILKGQIISSDNLPNAVAFMQDALPMRYDKMWSNNLWINFKLWRRAYRSVIRKLAGSNVLHSSAREYETFTRFAPFHYFCFEYRIGKKYPGDIWKDKREEELKKISPTRQLEYIALGEYTGIPKKKKFSAKDIKNNILNKFISSFYNTLMHKRHSLAHSFHLFSKTGHDFNELGQICSHFENHYFYFMMLIYLDIVLQQYFTEFQRGEELRII